MESLTEKLDFINKQVESDKAKFEQLAAFENTLKSLEKIISLEKPSYVFPLVDTLGKQTFTALNKK